MYTTTNCKALSGPVATFSVITGVACCLAQDGSFAISIGFIFGGVPVYVTFPEMLPLGGGDGGEPAPATPPSSTAPVTSKRQLIFIGLCPSPIKTNLLPAARIRADWLDLRGMLRHVLLPQIGFLRAQGLEGPQGGGKIPGVL